MKTTLAVAIAMLWTASHVIAVQHFDGKSWWHHVEVLAADDMEGRGLGSAGLKRAQDYVVTNLRKLGIGPAGTNGYFQPLRVVVREVIAGESKAALVRDGNVIPLTLGEDVLFTPSVELSSAVDAPLVFIGYGLKIPEKNHDDFAGIGLKGKVAVSLSWPPEGVTGLLAAHYLAEHRRWEQLRAAGAIGWIHFAWPGADWSFVSGIGAGSTTDLVTGNSSAQSNVLAMLFNPAHADKLFDGSGHTAQELLTLARTGKPVPRFDLPVRIRATPRMVKRYLDSANIIAKFDGRDPRLRNEYIVVSAHLDGHGIRDAVNGDAIFNGAIDNASGVATLLDIAAQLKRDAPRRSVLFAFFTAEEGGLLGSKYFVAHPTVASKSIVANLNVDNVQVIVPLNAVEVLGMDDSDLGDVVRRVTTSQGLSLDLDSRLGNSDHLSFIDAGIPAIKINVGFPGELAAVQEAWRKERYHTPFDDLQQPVDVDAAAKYEEFVRALMLDVASGPRRPEWKPDRFYRRYVAR
jgi:hypothetical protein